MKWEGKAITVYFTKYYRSMLNQRCVFLSIVMVSGAFKSAKRQSRAVKSILSFDNWKLQIVHKPGCLVLENINKRLCGSAAAHLTHEAQLLQIKPYRVQISILKLFILTFTTEIWVCAIWIQVNVNFILDLMSLLFSVSACTLVRLRQK